MQTREKNVAGETAVKIAVSDAVLNGDLAVPAGATGIIVFAHGSGSSRKSSRNRYVASVLQKAGLATLLFDLLTEQEEREEEFTRHLRFDIGLLARRLVGATAWLDTQEGLAKLRVGYFGASTGGGAAIVAAAHLSDRVSAVVSRGGRPDLAGDALAVISCPTLLIVGGNDDAVIGMNHNALSQMKPGVGAMKIVPGATHLFEEPGTLEQVAVIARDWFGQQLSASAADGAGYKWRFGRETDE